MGAAEQKCVGFKGGNTGLIEQFGEVDVEDFAGDGVVDPAFFDKRDEQRAGFLNGAKLAFAAGGQVGVAFHRGGSGDDHDIAGAGMGLSSIGAGFNDSENGHRDRSTDGVECEG